MGGLWEWLRGLLNRDAAQSGEAERKGMEMVQNRGSRGQVAVFYPLNFPDAKRVARELAAMRPVIVNLEGMPLEQAQRVIDYVSGTTYYLGGDLQKVGEYIFLFTPEGVQIDAEQLLSEGRDGEPPFL